MTPTNDVMLRHLLDLCRRSEKTGDWQYSGFLSPAEQEDLAVSPEAAGFPYFFTGGHEEAERKILAAGCEEELKALWRRLDARRTRCMALLGALYRFIDDIDDSLIRQIMIYRYIDGLTWKEVAAAIGEADEQYPRRLHNHFLAITPLPRGAEMAGDEPLEGRNGG